MNNLPNFEKILDISVKLTQLYTWLVEYHELNDGEIWDLFDLMLKKEISVIDALKIHVEKETKRVNDPIELSRNSEIDLNNLLNHLFRECKCSYCSKNQPNCS